MAYFTYRFPTGDELTKNQRIAIAAQDNNIIITGPPGTGKTVVSLFRLLNSNDEKNVIFFTYMTLLKYSISHHITAGRDYEKVFGEKVLTVYQWFTDNLGGWVDFEETKIPKIISELKNMDVSFHEIIIDEGQDLPDSIFKILQEITNRNFIGADNKQTVFETNTDDKVQEIKDCFDSIREIALESNYRNNYKIFNFAISFFPDEKFKFNNTLEELKKRNPGKDKPEIHIIKNDIQRDNLLPELLEAHSHQTIGVLFSTTGEVDSYYSIFLNKYNVECSKWHKNAKDFNKKLKSIILTTFKSAKGVEFDIIIIINFHRFAKKDIKEYYVGVTRARSNVYMISYNNVPDFVLNNFDNNTYNVEKY